jgi:hypothetical protein
MRAWLYDLLVDYPNLQGLLGGVEEIQSRIIPRESQSNINLPRPFIVYGLGNSTAEGLVDPTDPDMIDPEGQFSQIWVHDESGDYTLIDDILHEVKGALRGASSPVHHVLSTRYLETSQEFASEQYGTIFRYARFQHTIAEGVPA